MTGCGPARHGVFDHRYYDAAEGRMKVNHSGRIRVLDQPGNACLPRLAARSSRSTYWAYSPPRSRCVGIVVSGMDAPHLDAALSAAPEFAARLKAECPATPWATSEAVRPNRSRS